MESFQDLQGNPEKIPNQVYLIFYIYIIVLGNPNLVPFITNSRD